MCKWTCAIQTCLGHPYQQYSLGCSVNSDALSYYPEIAFWNIAESVAHLIIPFYLCTGSFPLSFSRIHLDLWLTHSMGTGWNHINCHCPSSVPLLSLVNEWIHSVVSDRRYIAVFPNCPALPGSPYVWKETETSGVWKSACHLALSLILD